MTWGEYIKNCAQRLVDARTEQQANELIQEFEAELKRDPPPVSLDFWGRLKAEYDALPKRILKEATAAAMLNALLSRVNALLAARVKK